MSYLTGGFGGTVCVSVPASFLASPCSRDLMGDADISGRRGVVHKSEVLRWNPKHVGLERSARFIHRNLEGHFGKGGGQIKEPDFGGQWGAVTGSPAVEQS